MTAAGKHYSTRIDYPKGDPENPLSWNELKDKFQDLVSPIFSEFRQNQILDELKFLEQADDVNVFSRLLIKE